MAIFMPIFCVVLVLCFFSVLLRWNEVRYRKKGLPPGTMGWPVFGETTEFLKQGPDFMINKRTRFGSFFKSHILGCPTIVSMDAELNRYILMNESKGLVPGYPQSMLDILGKCNIAAVHGSTHKYMRGALLSIISPTLIRDQLLPKIDEFMRTHLSDWANKVINIQEKTKEIAFLSSLKQIAGMECSSISQPFMTEFFKLVLGTLSLPINVPGTNYSRGFQARKNIMSILSNLLEERKASQEIHLDMLGCLMERDENRYKLSDEEILDLIITIMYSGYETVSTTSMMAVKYLHDHPKVLEEIRKEQLAIRERKRPEDPIDCSDLKSMRFTRAVIFETSRLATIVNGVLRKTTHDMELNGGFYHFYKVLLSSLAIVVFVGSRSCFFDFRDFFQPLFTASIKHVKICNRDKVTYPEVSDNTHAIAHMFHSLTTPLVIRPCPLHDNFAENLAFHRTFLAISIIGTYSFTYHDTFT